MFSLTSLPINCSDNLFHGRVRDGHIEYVTMLHDSRDHRFEWCPCSIDRQLQTMPLCLQYLHTLCILHLFMNGGRQPDTQALSPTFAIYRQQRMCWLFQEQIDSFHLQVVTLELRYGRIKDDLTMINHNRAAAHLLDVAC